MIQTIAREPDSRIDKSRPRIVWKGIKPEIVMDFLNGYKPDERSARVVVPDKIAEYIQKLNLAGELTSWTVAIVSNDDKNRVHTIDSMEIEGHRIGSVEAEAIQ